MFLEIISPARPSLSDLTISSPSFSTKISDIDPAISTISIPAFDDDTLLQDQLLNARCICGS